TVGKSKEF
ncbi:hypothetical protein VTL71DRAFT_1498, partial [Oculimacula yallundae]